MEGSSIMTRNITVIGAGSWGTSLSILLEANNHKVKVYSHSQEEVDEINSTRINSSKLPGIKISKNIFFTNVLEEALENSEIIVLVVPSQAIREVSKQINNILKRRNITIVCCSKGFENSTGKLLSEVIKEEIPECNICILTGPSHAEEVALNIPTAVVSASNDIDVAEEIQQIFMNEVFRVYTSTDVIGVEVAGAMKNIIALCAGISDGLGYGDNTKAALMTRGIAEISRLGVAMGAGHQTFLGLAGIGDLIVTCTSNHSRNRRAGMLIGKGLSLKDALEQVKMVVEGAEAAKVINDLSKKWNVEMPISTEAFLVLYENKSPREAVRDLMIREKKDE
jgi:glycerol-3-phosphate dehydrogenase (NAD(P)+)